MVFRKAYLVLKYANRSLYLPVPQTVDFRTVLMEAVEVLGLDFNRSSLSINQTTVSLDAKLCDFGLNSQKCPPYKPFVVNLIVN